MDMPLHEGGVYAFGPFRLDPASRTLLRHGAPVTLTSRLFETLLYLVQHPQRVVEREELERAVWRGRSVEDGNLQKAISSLRKVLQAGDPAETYILTVQGRGFQFSVPVAIERGDAEWASALVPVEPESARPSPRHLLPRGMFVPLLGVAVLLLAATAIAWRSVPRKPDIPFAPPPHSVAVLAFANMSGDAREDYFSDGLADELINTLSRNAGLHVAARTSAFSFKGETATIGEMGRRLGVGAILEGSVRRDRQRIHIAVQLIDARTGFQFWSRSYDRDRFLDDMLKVQTDIAESVSASLEAKLMDNGAANLTVGGTHDAKAFDAYLRGMNNNREMDEVSAKQAVVDFTDAIALDPAYARAFAGRAAAHNFLVISGFDADAEADARETMAAVADADRAIALAPMLAEAHRVKSIIMFNALNFKGSVAELARAADLAPNDAMVEASRATSEALLGHFQIATIAARHAIALDPLNPYVYREFGQTLFWMRHFDEALEAFGHATAVDKRPSRANLSWAASSDLAKGDPATAEHICVAGHAWTDDACLAIAYHVLGRQADADAKFASLNQAFGDRAAYIYAEIYAQWGRPAEALRWLKTAYTLKDSGLSGIKVSPFLDPIRNYPQFTEIQNRLGFPP